MHSCLMLLQPSPSSRVLHIQQWGIREVWVGWVRAMVWPSNRRGKYCNQWKAAISYFFNHQLPLWQIGNSTLWALAHKNGVESEVMGSRPIVCTCNSPIKKSICYCLFDGPILAVCWLIMGWTKTPKAGSWILGMFLLLCCRTIQSDCFIFFIIFFYKQEILLIAITTQLHMKCINCQLVWLKWRWYYCQLNLKKTFSAGYTPEI